MVQTSLPSEQVSARPKRERLHALLMARGLLSSDGLQRLHGLTDPGELHLVRTLVGHGLCPGPALASALADHWELPQVDLSRSEVDLMPLVVLSRNEAVANLVLPFSASGLKLHLAVASPEAAAEFAPELARRSGLTVQLYVASLSDLLRTIGAAYDAAQAGQRAFQGPDFPKNASRSSLRACAITPWRGVEESHPLPELQQRPASARGSWSPQTGSFPTPSGGTTLTPASVSAIRRPPPEELVVVKAPAVRHAALANDIANALAELAPDAPAPLIATPLPPAPPETVAAPEPEEETRTGLRLLAHRIKVVANTEVPLPFKRTQNGQQKAATSAGKTVPPSARSEGAPDQKKASPQSGRFVPPSSKP